jgi:hypothetical protein
VLSVSDQNVCHYRQSHAHVRPVYRSNRQFNPSDRIRGQNNCGGNVENLKNVASLYLSSRCADTFSFSVNRPAGIAAKTVAPESVRAIPSPFRAAHGPNRVRRSTR